MKSKKVEKVGFVVSAKNKKTVTVKVERLVMHPIYKKYVRRSSKFLAHDELSCKVGDKVRIVESRPLSARKRWVVKELMSKVH
ncbi:MULTISPECIES: 30S ribosomal protein S17 [Chloracidobacterium]|jgi:small subunit ribosomal protein S17|uniref:30S ribosomal protein S17 n=1 Tax=Chloracidobacterium TaxID=458032 RepID=UPI0009D9A735|nr:MULTISPECIES: 30S ribosomal protein S17 [Chloracidobacterium]QUV77989.1 30S ribosomal protein S17 [Chloracidobacterium thermophilum]QUV81045.1 30S ribosomal protein S17 [Chloracidobacterium sp. D]